MMRKFYSFLLVLFAVNYVDAQATFQKQFSQPDSASSFETFDAKATPDGGFILTGLASQGTANTYHPFLLKLNCKGEIVWQKFFGNSQTIGNIFPKVIVTQDSSYVMINNLGIYTNYNGLVVRVEQDGTIQWQKLLNLSSGNDIISDIKETQDEHLIITGAAMNTADVSLVKLSRNGDLVWHKTFGNAGNIDEGTALIETNDGGYLVTGRYISMLTFNAFLLKTDSSGTMQWHKCYGDTNQHAWGMDVKQTSNGDIIMVGSTTLLKPSYTSYSDNFIMRLNSAGDTLWTKIIYGNPDFFESASSVEIDNSGNFILGIATASYPTAGFVPNKHAIFKISASGNLLFANTYNSGSSHYTRINKSNDDGYLLTGFSNRYSYPIGFQTLFMKLDSNLATGCFQTDVLAMTTVSSKTFRITQPTVNIASSGTIANNNTTWNTVIKDSTLCSNFPLPLANFTTSGVCLGDTISFNADTLGLISWHWHFGDSGNVDTASIPTPSYVYNSSGTYTVMLIVSNGCDIDSMVKSITVFPQASKPYLGDDTIICAGASIVLSSNIAASNYVWSTGDTVASINVTQAGHYILTTNTQQPCGSKSDTINVGLKSCDSMPVLGNCELFIPSAFSPNGDTYNDKLGIKIPPSYTTIEFLEMAIYNRWGNVVFSTNNVNEAWDGTYKGQPQNIDTYYYFVRFKCGTEIRTNKGDVLLIR